MGKYSRLGKNTVLVFIGSAGSKMMSLLMLPFYTRWLTVGDYGTVDLITTYSWLLIGIVSCGIFDSIFIFPKDKPECRQAEYFCSGLLFCIATSLMAALIFAGLDCMAWPRIIPDFIRSNLWSIYAVIFANYLQSFVQQFLRSIDKMIVYSVTGIVMTACMILFSFLLIPEYGVNGYIAALVLGSLCSVIYSAIAGRLWIYVRADALKVQPVKEMLSYSIPLIPNGIMWFLIASLNRPVLESYVGLWAVGIFAVAGKFPNLLNTFYLLFQNAWLISVLEEAKRPDFSVFYNNMLKIVVAVQIFIAVALSFGGKIIIKIFATPDFYSAWQYIPLLVTGVIFMNVATFVGSWFAVTRESRYYFYSTALSGFASLILNFAFIPICGLWGACWAMIFSQFIGMAARIKFTWNSVRITDIAFYIGNALFLTCGVASPILLDGTHWLYISAVALTGIFCYINRLQISKVIEFIKLKYRREAI